MKSLMFLVLLSFAVAALTAVAATCTDETCKPPNCRCSSDKIPGGLESKETPQIVMLTFDDAVNAQYYRFYYSTMMKKNNPNGCPIGITYFVSHEYCDYTLVNELYKKRHEIASHSISHVPNTDFWKRASYEEWRDEMVGLRDIVTKFAGVPEADIKGIRVPFLQPAGNAQFEVMKDHDFTWDCSHPTRNQLNMWPFTLDYPSKLECQIPPCPTDSFPGTWLIPMISLFDKDGNPCAMLDNCVTIGADDTYELLKTNFLRNYNGNRVPYGLYLHSSWFLRNVTYWEGYRRFLDEIVAMDDVYIVTVSQMLEWVRNPVRLDEAKDFAPWKTQCSPLSEPECDKPMTCQLYNSNGFERWMTFCGKSCPAKYPWVGNPLGNP